MANPKDHARVRYVVSEHKAGNLANGCRCGLQAGHPGDCQPRETGAQS